MAKDDVYKFGHTKSDIGETAASSALELEYLPSNPHDLEKQELLGDRVKSLSTEELLKSLRLFLKNPRLAEPLEL